MIDMIGFIMTRHVMSEETNQYWIECYKCIRKHYHYKIVIIDDNSDAEFLHCEEELINCIIIQSEFPKRGELLAYYYFHQYHFFEKAIIIHDSVLFQKKFDFENEETNNTKIKFLNHFVDYYEFDDVEIDCLQTLCGFNNDLFYTLLEFYKLKGHTWRGCFGIQSVIDYSFLCDLQEKYSFFNLINYIDCREKRQALERIFGLLCCMENPDLFEHSSLFGNIFHYVEKYSPDSWSFNYHDYLVAKNNQEINDYYFIKIFTGR